MLQIIVETVKILNMSQVDDDQIVSLETKFAYLEDFVKQLQEQVVLQGKYIERLQNENVAMREKLRDVSEMVGDIPNRKPPHY